MSKMKLQIDNLTVESFETSDVGGERRGTVLGAADVVLSGPLGCGEFDTRNTGPCCEITLVQSCVETSCLAECHSHDANVCLA